MTPAYSDNTDIYELYRAPARFIEFEGNVYKFKGVERKADVNVHVYRCETEQHYLRIHLQEGKPFYVEGVYKVEDSSNAVRRVV